MIYENVLHFYKKHENTLIYGELRPAKSVTRNIATGVVHFISYYRTNGNRVLTEKQIAREILGLDCDASSTSKDNIRNMQELKFISKLDNSGYYHLTNNFVEFCNSGLTISEYIFQDLMRISNLSDITMFYNYIICTLIDGMLHYGAITLYPESFSDFKLKVDDFEERKRLCEEVYKIYGFKGRSGSMFGTYTPNANYRIVSTCTTLRLIKRSGTDRYGFKKYSLTTTGEALLSRLNLNLLNK